MPEVCAVHNHVTASATNKDAINELSHLHCQQRLRNAIAVLGSIEWEKRMDDRRNVGRLKDIGHGDARGSCMDKLSSGAITADEETVVLRA